MKKHPEWTLEPWRVEMPKKTKHRQCRWIMSGTHYIAKVYGGTDYMSAGDAIANGDRLVACVNACKNLNPAAVPDLVNAVEDAIAEGYTRLSPEAWNKLCQAIEKATKEVK